MLLFLHSNFMKSPTQLQSPKGEPSSCPALEFQVYRGSRTCQSQVVPPHSLEPLSYSVQLSLEILHSSSLSREDRYLSKVGCNFEFISEKSFMKQQHTCLGVNIECSGFFYQHLRFFISFRYRYKP